MPRSFAAMQPSLSWSATTSSRSRQWFGLRDSGDSSERGETGNIDRGCVKTSARFHTSLFRSLLRGLRAFSVEKIAKSLALLDRLQNFAEFLHGLDPELPFKGQRTNGREARESGRWPKAVLAPQRIVLSMARQMSQHGTGK